MSQEDLMAPTQEEVSNLGTVRVVARRRHREHLSKPRGSNLPKQQPQVPDEVLKKKLVENRKTDDKFVNHNVKFGVGIPVEEPTRQSQSKYHSVAGQAGRDYEFVFKYRDRKLLQNLQIINPEAPAEDNMDEETKKLHKELLEQKTREIERLKASTNSLGQSKSY